MPSARDALSCAYRARPTASASRSADGSAAITVSRLVLSQDRRGEPSRTHGVSASGEFCGALLEKGGDAFAEIRRRRGEALEVALDIELRVEAVLERAVQRLLDEAEADRRPVGESPREAARLG